MISWWCGYCHGRKPQALLGVPRRPLRHYRDTFKTRSYAAILKSHQIGRRMRTLLKIFSLDKSFTPEFCERNGFCTYLSPNEKAACRVPLTSILQTKPTR